MTGRGLVSVGCRGCDTRGQIVYVPAAFCGEVEELVHSPCSSLSALYILLPPDDLTLVYLRSPVWSPTSDYNSCLRIPYTYPGLYTLRNLLFSTLAYVPPGLHTADASRITRLRHDILVAHSAECRYGDDAVRLRCPTAV